MDSDAPESRALPTTAVRIRPARHALRDVVTLTDGNGKIGILTGVLDAENLHERIAGMEEVFANHPDMEIVAMEGDDYLIDVGIQKVTALFQAHPEMNTIVGLHSARPRLGAGLAEEIGVAACMVGWSKAGVCWQKFGHLGCSLPNGDANGKMFRGCLMRWAATTSLTT